ncbi:restriction endonuclease subunit S [Aeromonas sanarellii]
MVPNGWSQKTLEDLSIVERGKFSARPRNDPRYFGGEMPFVQTGDVTGSKTYLNSFTQTLNQDGIGVSKVFPKGTILITIAANIGDTAITSFDVACPDSVVAIQPYSTKADTYWLKNVLDTKKEDLDSQSTQNAQKNINLQVLKPLVILTPPLSEQKKIAKILSTWDKANSTTEQLLANSQQQKKALMQQLLTGKKRLLDNNGVRFSGGWCERLLGDISKITTGSSNRQDSHMNGAYTFFDRSEDIRTSDTYLFDCEAVIVPGEGQDFIPKYFVGKFDLHQRTYAIMDFPECHGKFLFYAIHYFRSHFLSQAVGSTVKSLRLPMFQKMKLNLPTFEEQQKIAAVLSSADQEISVLQHKLDALKLEKKALMQQLLTGKRRVKVEEAA